MEKNVRPPLFNSDFKFPAQQLLLQKKDKLNTDTESTECALRHFAPERPNVVQSDPPAGQPPPLHDVKATRVPWQSRQY